MGERRLKLIQARAYKHWTQAQAAGFVGVDETTYRKWESGMTTPHPGGIQRLCDVYGCSDVELGFCRDLSSVSVLTSPSESADEARYFIASDPTMCLLSLASSPLLLRNMQYEVIKLLEEQNMHNDSLSRREALRRLATLPIALLHLNATTPTRTAQPEAVLSQCAAGVVACWYLRKGKELALANSAVSAYIPTLADIAASSSRHRLDAADILAQCYLLKTALSYNITTSADGIGYALQAETYSQIAENPLLQIAALRARASVLCYANQWGHALTTGLQARQIMETTQKDLIPSLTRSYVYAGLATYQAYHQQKQEALTSLKKAHAMFFAQSESEAVPLWIDHSMGNLLLNDGLTHAHLGLYAGAVDSFGQVEKYPDDTAIPFGCRVENRIEQVLAEVSRDDRGRDMDKCITIWTQGVEGAKAMQSNKHFSDALIAYTAMKAAWPGEQRVKALRDLTLHW